MAKKKKGINRARGVNPNCWWSKKEGYATKTISEVFNIDPDYILWCFKNMKLESLSQKRLSPEMWEKIQAHDRHQQKRGITKTTVFK